MDLVMDQSQDVLCSRIQNEKLKNYVIKKHHLS